MQSRHIAITLITAVALATAGFASSAAAETEAPATVPADASASPAIEKLHAGLLGVMQDAENIGYEGRVERLRSIVTESFDLPFMAEKSVGRHWRKLSDEEQQRWLGSFHEMTAATYAGRFEGYSGQSFEVVGEEAAKHDTVVVRAMLHNPDGDDVQLNYRLHRTDDGAGPWKVIDVYLNGTVSELALRRSEYSSVLKRDGFAKLIETIDGKTQELAASAVN